MNVIYEPKGRAREYAPLAANLYNGCNHHCIYCYCSRMNKAFGRGEHFVPDPTVRKGVISAFKGNAKTFAGNKMPVHFSFTTDPYNTTELRLKLMRELLPVCLENRIPVTILSKSPYLLRDLDLFLEFGPHIKVGMSLTFIDEEKSLSWEKRAATPQKRIEILKRLSEHGIKTWASFEPVIEPEESLKMMDAVMPYCDLFKIGKLNDYKGLDKGVDWKSFFIDSENKMNANNKLAYFKKDLCEAAGFPSKIEDPDNYEIVEPF